MFWLVNREIKFVRFRCSESDDIWTFPRRIAFNQLTFRRLSIGKLTFSNFFSFHITILYMTATGLKLTINLFVREHSTIYSNWTNDWTVLWVLINEESFAFRVLKTYSGWLAWIALCRYNIVNRWNFLNLNTRWNSNYVDNMCIK